MQLSETDIRSPASTLRTVRADDADPRGWLAGSPVCPPLAHHRIRHIAVGAIVPPFEIVRTQLGGSYFLAACGGEGRVLVDGRWARCRGGQAVLFPPGTLQAFKAVTMQPWEICWVRYQERPGQKPLATVQTPVLARFDAAPLRLAMEGLHHECRTVNAPAAVERWVELIQQYVVRFAAPAGLDTRVWTLWDRVAADLAHDWNTRDMERLTHLSEKQLQRLCRRDLGRTPRQQLIWLRMRRAAELLMNGEGKVETIAQQVGYQNPFVFSTTFKRIMGWSPSEYRDRAQRDV